MLPSTNPKSLFLLPLKRRKLSEKQPEESRFKFSLRCLSDLDLWKRFLPWESSPLNHHLGEYFLLFPNILCKSKQMLKFLLHRLRHKGSMVPQKAMAPWWMSAGPQVLGVGWPWCVRCFLHFLGGSVFEPWRLEMSGIYIYLNDHSYGKFNDLGLSYYKFTSRWENQNSTWFLSIVCFFGNVKKSSSCWGLSSCWGTVVLCGASCWASLRRHWVARRPGRHHCARLGFKRINLGQSFSTYFWT